MRLLFKSFRCEYISKAFVCLLNYLDWVDKVKSYLKTLDVNNN